MSKINPGYQNEITISNNRKCKQNIRECILEAS